MNTGTIFQSLGTGVAIALLCLAAVRKLSSLAPMKTWLQHALPRWPADATLFTVITLELVAAGLLMIAPMGTWLNVTIVSFCLLLLVGQWLLKRSNAGACPCLGKSEVFDPDAPFRSVLLVIAVNGLALFPTSLLPVPVTALPLLVAISILGFVVALNGSSVRSTTDSSSTRIPTALRHALAEAIPDFDELETFAGRGSIYFGSLDCQGCVQYGQQYGELSRRLPPDWTAFIDMDVEPPTPTRMGGARLLRLGLSLRKDLGLRIRPALIEWHGQRMRLHQGPGQCAAAFADLLSHTNGGIRLPSHPAGNQA